MTSKPSFLNVLQVPAVAAPSALGGAAGSNTLAFMMQAQTETQWCWAAVSTSVSKFFDTSSTWSQCTVANNAWSRTDCCSTGASGPCNKPWYLDLALGIVSVFDQMTSSIETFADTKSEINNGRPLCIRVGWSGGGGHFLAIFGWQETASGERYYRVDDPIYGSQRIRKSKLETSYQGTGTWTHSYYVSDPTGLGGAVAAGPTDFPEALGA